MAARSEGNAWGVTGIQTFVNVVLFFWLLALTALVVRWRWGSGAGSSAHREDEQLVERVENGQRVIRAMSEDLLSLTERIFQELDELRTTVSSLKDRPLQSHGDSQPESPSVIDHKILHPSLERYRDVYWRASQGKSVTLIAQELGMGKGEVELVLALGQQLSKDRHKS